MLRAASILTMLLSTSAVAGQPTWITMQNENFCAYSSASERATRDALNQFERVRGFFLQLTGAKPDKAVPVTVVIFGSEKEYQPYRLNAFATAYYSSWSDRDLIVVGKLGEESARTATHEYTHLVFKHDGFSLPPWLNEGVAELFSTLRPAGNETEFGDVLIGRLQELNRDPWVPMETILAADMTSPYYNEAKQAGSLYNQSWALVHMLATTEKYRHKFWGMVIAVNNGVPSVQALETAYGVPFATIETELKSYIRGNSFSQLKVKIRLDDTEKLTSQPADMFEVREAQAELLIGLQGRQVEARTRFEELAREEVKRPEPWASLGYLALRDGKRDEAAEHFGKAFELGSRSPRLLMIYAQLAGRDKPESSAAALTVLLELEPKNLDARVELADLQMSQGQFSEALATTRLITSVKTAEQRDHLLYLRAFAAMRSGDVKQAHALAEELKRVTSSADLKSRADEILRYSDQR
ncbi:MAG TPA: tetratricopeptide repeat protein [Steroidobacteraceae bacterium]|nr:tetratricopeptide repeat protein [Steroidobacteraceae bacterium]